jgi:hypothetical protein
MAAMEAGNQCRTSFATRRRESDPRRGLPHEKARRPGGNGGPFWDEVQTQRRFLADFLAGLAGLEAALVARSSSMAAWAAARRATGTRYGEQDK